MTQRAAPSGWVKLYEAATGSLEFLSLAIWSKDFVGRFDSAKVANRFMDAVLTVDGEPKTVGRLNMDEDAGVDALIGFDPPVLAFFDDTVPATGADNISLTYHEGLSVRATQQDQPSVDAIAALEGNDGVYEGVVEDDTITTGALARARARQELEQFANPTVTISFVTRESGLRAGQLLSVSLTEAGTGRDLDGTFLIQAVTTRSLGSGNYEHTVTAGSRLKGVTDYIWELLKAGRPADEADDDNGLLEEMLYASDTFGWSDSFIGESGPMPPYVYGINLWLEDGSGFLLVESGEQLSINSITPAIYGQCTYEGS